MASDTSAQQSSRAVQSFWTDLQSVPNVLSLSRIFMTIAAAALYLNDYRGAGLIVGAVAGITDFLDGWLARKLNQSTELGALLDRLCDLVLETVALTVCLFYSLLPPSFLILYLLREWVVMTARLYVAENGGTIPSSSLGKRKTNLVLGSFAALFASHAGFVTDLETAEIVYKVGYAMMVGGLVFSYASGAQYLQSFARVYNSRAK